MEINKAIEILENITIQPSSGDPFKHHFVDPERFFAARSFILSFLSKIQDAEMPKRMLLEDIIKYLGEGYSRETYAVALQTSHKVHDDFLAYHLKKIWISL